MHFGELGECYIPLHSTLEYGSRMSFSNWHDSIAWNSYRLVRQICRGIQLARDDRVRSCSSGSGEFSRHTIGQGSSTSHEERMGHGSFIAPTSRSMKAVRLELTKKGFELGLTEILCQKRNNSILVVDFEGLALRIPGNNMAMVFPLGFIQKSVKIRRKMLGVSNLPS